MAQSRKFSEKINNANYEVNTNLTTEEQGRLAQFPGLGYYSRTSLNDVINNFIVSHIGEGKVLTKVPRHEVAFWAQRGLQEFSYDILYADKTIEFELNPSLTFPLPSDFVNYVKISYIDRSGTERIIIPDRTNASKQGILQDSDFNYVYDNNGEKMIDSKSESIKRFQREDQLNDSVNQEYGYFSDEVFDYYYSGYFGRRFGADTERTNNNGRFVMDLAKGIVYLDSSFQVGDIIAMQYISDGIGDNDDLSNVYLPKMAEDALYAFMLYNIAKLRTATAQIAPMYKKEASAKMRNAKIRLQNYHHDELAFVMRGKAKWIKH